MSAVGFCLTCQQNLSAPCKPGLPPEGLGLVATRRLVDPQAAIIRGLPDEAIKLKSVKCQIGRLLAEMGLTREEVRSWVLYKLVHGDEAGIIFQWPCGTPMKITVELVEEAFDGRRQEVLPVSSVSWSNEIMASDRAIGETMRTSIAGRIRTAPDRRLLHRFRLILMAAKVGNFDVDVSDED